MVHLLGHPMEGVEAGHSMIPLAMRVLTVVVASILVLLFHSTAD